MPEYRLYFIGADGHFASVKTLESPDDQAAIETAATYIDGRSMELWNDDRMIKSFPTSH